MTMDRLRSRLFLWIGVLLIVATCQSVNALAAEKRRGPILDIHGADKPLAAQIDSIVQVAHKKLVSYGVTRYTDSLSIYVVSQRSQFDSLTGGHFPDWGAGCAIPERRMIIILSPYHFHFEVSLPEILHHEFAHIYLHHLVDGLRVPRWMNEGFAMLIAHQWRFGDDWRVARAVFSQSTVPLESMEVLNHFSAGKARLAYAESYLAINHFLETYGWESFILFIRELPRNHDWDAAFMSAIGLEFAGFEEEFSQYLHEKYNWVVLFSDTLLLWVILAAAFVAFYLIKRHRARKKLAEWAELHPDDEPPMPFPGRRGN